MDLIQNVQLFQLQHTAGQCLSFDTKTNAVGMADCAIPTNGDALTTVFVTDNARHGHQSTAQFSIRPLQKQDHQVVPSPTTSEVLVVPLSQSVEALGRTLYVAEDNTVRTAYAYELPEGGCVWKLIHPFVISTPTQHSVC